MNEVMEELSTADYKEQFVAFIDILGYSEILKNSTNPVGDIAIIQGLMDAYKKAADGTKIINSVVFSDSMYIISGNLKEMIRFISLLQVNLLAAMEIRTDASDLKNGLKVEYGGDGRLLRGGIAYGSAYTSPKNSNSAIITGPAVLTAYKLESTVAVYPRIVLDLKACKHIAGHEKKFCLKQDKDGLWYVDFLSYYHRMMIDDYRSGRTTKRDMIESYKDTIMQWEKWTDTKIKGTNSEKIMQKYCWFMNYLKGAEYIE